jgi:serine protease Do
MMIGEGSGFFISADGYIVTNNHVAAHAQSVQITTDAAATQDVVPDIFDTC